MHAATTPPASRWPIDPPHRLTSSFGEYRKGHFHGGIDFSTEQKTGRRIYAVADGWVWRVRASGSGYGRSLYARLSDGRTAVYAHLDRFNPEIAAFVEAAQESLSRYEVDLYPGPNRLPFAAGDVLGWTGDSGAGPAHLHFEIREGEGADLGVNPLLSGFDMADTTAPLLSVLKVRPEGRGSTVNGLRDPAILPVRYVFGRGYDAPPVTIAGGALLAIQAMDPTETGNRLAPWSAEIGVDGTTLYTFRLDRFDWNSAHQVELAYDAERALHGELFFMNLFRPDGASDPAFDASPPLTGRLGSGTLAVGDHDVTIVVRDAAMNEARLNLKVRIEEPLLDDPPDPENLFRVARGRALTFRRGAITVSAPDRAFFGPGAILFTEVPVTAGETTGIKIAGRGIRADAPDLVMDRAVRVAIHPESAADSAGLALYRTAETGDFTWVGDERRADGIGGDTRTLETFVLARDVLAPSVRVREPRADVAAGNRPPIDAVITDRGSGFTWNRIVTEIDGVTQIVVFDPESSRLSGRSRRTLAAGAHMLVIRVSDRAGNETKVERTFRVAR